MALAAGNHNAGTVFSLSTDGSDYETLHHFNGTDGNSPHGDVIHVGDWMYGLTRWGGTSNLGVVFALHRDTHDYQILHSFGGYPIDGDRGHFGILHHDGVLYGQTWVGGAYNSGSIWRVDTNGQNYEMLHSLTTSEGYHAHGYLVWLEGWLVGMSPEGGLHGGGSAYRIRPDGSDFEIIHSFGSQPGDVRFGIAEFLVVGNQLYACPLSGGAHSSGGICRMHVDGSDYEVIYSFTGSYGDPTANTLVRDDAGFFYGVVGGGQWNSGSVYRYSPFTPNLQISWVDDGEEGLVELEWDAQDMLVYQLQSSAQAWPPAWENLGDPLNGEGLPLNVSVTVEESEQRFFRVVTLDP